MRDLSHGWGHNSQWGTDFRRDYIVGDQLHYNVDQTGKQPRSDNALAAGDRLDLLRHRCSVRADLGDDQRPYGDTLIEPSPAR